MDEMEYFAAICESEEELAQMADFGLPAFGLERNGVHLSAPYIVTDPGAVTEDFVHMVYCRHYGLPRRILETHRTIVREICEEDIDDLFALYEPEEITRYTEGLFPYEEELSYQRKYIENIYGFYGYGMWVVIDKTSGRLMGRAGIESRADNPAGEGELGYVIGVPWQHRGIATEVCRAIMTYAAEVLDMESLCARIHPDNLPSRRVAGKLGFHPTDEMRDGEQVWRWYKAE